MNKSKTIISGFLLASAIVFSTSDLSAQCGRCGPDGFDTRDGSDTRDDYDYYASAIITSNNVEAKSTSIQINVNNSFMSAVSNNAFKMIDLTKKEEEPVLL